MRVVLPLAVFALALMTMGVSVCGNSVPAPTPKMTPPLTGDTVFPTPPPDHLAGLSNTPRPTIAPITYEQRQRVNEIVQADPTLIELVGGSSFGLTQVGPWYTDSDPATGEGIFIGAVATVVLGRTIAHIERDWPFAGYRPFYGAWPADAKAKYLPYTEGTERRAVDNLKFLEASVDLTRGLVVGYEISGDESQRVSYPTRSPFPEASFGVSPTVQAIFNADTRLSAILAGRQYQGPLAFTQRLEAPHFNVASEVWGFEEPQTIEADWLMSDGDPLTGNYHVDPIHFLASDVRSISAVADLDTGEVISIQPSKHAPGD